MNKYINKRVEDSSWNFLTSNTKEYTHCYHIYPAMMIPQIARRIIKEFAPKNSKFLFDPYCGTGTSLVEANLLGISNVGSDLNPLARLISKVKNVQYDSDKILKVINMLSDDFFIKSISGNINANVPNFKNIDYWFSEEVKLKLSYIYDRISELSNDIKDFFLLPFSETIREGSFTRNNEFKLFKIKKEKLESFNPDVFNIFLAKCFRNLEGLKEFRKITNITNTEVYGFDTCNEIPEYVSNIDIVVTSPPYGDSKTTVAYGQFSRLSNQWLGFEDANQVDNNLMGGRNGKDNELLDLKSVNEDLEFIRNIDRKRFSDVKSFLIDYKNSIENVSKKVKKNGIVCYVVGNRRVKGRQIQLDAITAELFENNGFKHITTIVRSIPNKRMPSKNSPSNVVGSIAETMSNEYIVLCEKYFL